MQIKKSLFLILGIILSTLIRSYLILNGSRVADVHSLQEMGELYLGGINPYLALSYNPYPPLAIYIEAATVKLASFLNIPFHILTKIWPNLADLLIALILYKFLTKKGVKSNSATFWSLAFFLNPISILISAAHGQIDSITTLLVIISVYLLIFYYQKIYIILSFFLLGLSIAIKPNPLILLPIFLAFSKKSLKMKMVLLIISLSPVTVLFLPFVKDYPKYIMEKIFNYSGSYDFGIPGILRGLYYLKAGDYNLTFNSQILQIDKAFYLISLLLITFVGDSKKLIKRCLMAYVLFFTFYFGISAQYLSWILPLAVLKRERMIIYYSLFGLIAFLGFYLFINPKIIISSFSNIPPYQSRFMLAYFIGNLGLWITTLVWLIKLSKKS